jgi:hypothetical protein
MCRTDVKLLVAANSGGEAATPDNELSARHHGIRATLPTGSTYSAGAMADTEAAHDPWSIPYAP